MFGINAEKLLLIAIIAALVIGPSRLPEYATKLAHLVRALRRMATTAQDQINEQLGPEFGDVDWKKLDPRQYDPRRIIRDALTGDDEPANQPAPTASPVSGPPRAVQKLPAGQAAPFDVDAT